jgi:hypothetical protein
MDVCFGHTISVCVHQTLLMAVPDLHRRNVALGVVLAFAMLALVLAPGSDLPKVSVTTFHNNVFRQGLNSEETVLNLKNVNVRTFGKLFTHAVDGPIYAQPLYLSDLYIPGRGVHNVVFVATERNNVYAFDADTNRAESAQPLWKTSFNDPDNGITTVSSQDVGCGDIVPDIGITGTPVIDIASGTLYLVAKTKEDNRFVQRLHALDVATGEEKLGGPVTIEASVSGSGAGSQNGSVAFDPLREHQRAGLLLQDGIIYIAWAGHCDGWPYHGWIMAYDAGNLNQIGAWNATPNGNGGGIWQSGAAPVGNGRSCYFATGNGEFSVSKGGPNYGDSIVRLGWNSHHQLHAIDYFTPFDQENLNAGDVEPASAGSLMISPAGAMEREYLVQPSKSGTLYLIDALRMGRFNPVGNSNILQSIPAATGGIWGAPAWWNNTLYLGGTYDRLKAFRFDPAIQRFDPAPSSEGEVAFRFPGPTPSISADGDINGIVWIVQSDAYVEHGPAILRAYNAENLAQELYNSGGRGERDQLGPAVKFSVPTVANGHVYVGTQTGLTVFGLR